MAPNAMETDIFEQYSLKEPENLEKLVAPQATPYKYKLIYPNILYFIYLTVAALISIKYIFTAEWATLIFMYVYFAAGVMGLAAGVHRYWSHKSFKATLPLQIILLLCFSAINQFSVIYWVETHRQHHRYSDTDGDPNNSTRGLFFSHIGWVFMSKHPECLKRRKYIDVKDVHSDPLLVLQKKYYWWFVLPMAFLVPSLVPLLWGETFATAWGLNILRLFVTYNTVFTVNSLGHTLGYRPYDKSLRATQSNAIQFVAFGDGHHNFHHTFPWDYRSGEWGSGWSFTTTFIDAFAKIGWAYDMKTVDQDIIVARAERTGDGSKTFKTDY